jgi:hypothetical protein
LLLVFRKHIAVIAIFSQACKRPIGNGPNKAHKEYRYRRSHEYQWSFSLERPDLSVRREEMPVRAFFD